MSEGALTMLKPLAWVARRMTATRAPDPAPNGSPKHYAPNDARAGARHEAPRRTPNPRPLAAGDVACGFVRWAAADGRAGKWTVDEVWDMAQGAFAPAAGLGLPPRRTFLGALKKQPGVLVKADCRVYGPDGRQLRKTTYYRLPATAEAGAASKPAMKAAPPVVPRRNPRPMSAATIAAAFVSWASAQELASDWTTVEDVWSLAEEEFAPAVGVGLPPFNTFLTALKKQPGVCVAPNRRAYRRSGRPCKTTYYRLPAVAEASASVHAKAVPLQQAA